METGPLHDVAELLEAHGASAVPVKQVEGSPVERVWATQVRLKGHKLLKGDERSSILSLVQDPSIERHGVWVVAMLWQEAQEAHHKVLVREELLTAVGDAGVPGEHLPECGEGGPVYEPLPHLCTLSEIRGKEAADQQLKLYTWIIRSFTNEK